MIGRLLFFDSLKADRYASTTGSTTPMAEW
jgi:hypothetical protein